MQAIDNKELTKIVLTPIAAFLKQAGFKKTGQNFHKKVNDVIWVINVQKSQFNNPESMNLTVNLAVFSVPLAKVEHKYTEKPLHYKSHYTERLGPLSSYKRDKWWNMTSESVAHKVGMEIAKLLDTVALPHLQQLDTTQKLIALWKSGNHHIYLNQASVDVL